MIRLRLTETDMRPETVVPTCAEFETDLSMSGFIIVAPL